MLFELPGSRATSAERMFDNLVSVVCEVSTKCVGTLENVDIGFYESSSLCFIRFTIFGVRIVSLNIVYLTKVIVRLFSKY
jgi:hypothetical protein